MWLVTKIGFFNIIEQDDDAEKGLLTVKARARKDLQLLGNFLLFQTPIEESIQTDYRFRQKANKHYVANGIQQLVKEIDYPKTKPELAKLNPDRSDIYLQVWEDLYEIQTRHGPKT